MIAAAVVLARDKKTNVSRWSTGMNAKRDHISTGGEKILQNRLGDAKAPRRRFAVTATKSSVPRAESGQLWQ